MKMKKETIVVAIMLTAATLIGIKYNGKTHQNEKSPSTNSAITEEQYDEMKKSIDDSLKNIEQNLNKLLEIVGKCKIETESKKQCQMLDIKTKQK